MCALWQNQAMHCRYFDTTWKAITLFLWHQQWLVGDAPSVWNLCSEWPTPFEKCRLWQISAHNVSTVRDSEKIVTMNRKSAMGFSRSYWCSTYIITKSPKGWLKKRFFLFSNKTQFQSNKVCYKDSLCENFRRQSRSIAIPHITLPRYWRET